MCFGFESLPPYTAVIGFTNKPVELTASVFFFNGLIKRLVGCGGTTRTCTFPSRPGVLATWPKIDKKWLEKIKIKVHRNSPLNFYNSEKHTEKFPRRSGLGFALRCQVKKYQPFFRSWAKAYTAPPRLLPPTTCTKPHRSGRDTRFRVLSQIS